MNLLIFKADQLDQQNCLTVSGYQHQHLQTILKSKPGDIIRVGQINGCIGLAEIVAINDTYSHLQVLHLDRESPPQLPLDIILALPRPQMIKRILQCVATMGVRRLILIQSAKVEKSFWQSPSLSAQEVERQLILGLEQGIATQLPIIERYTRFIPFIEDSLANHTQSKQCFIAAPGDHTSLNATSKKHSHLLAIGPEGGFNEKEVEHFRERGFEPVSLGERILKVETAVTTCCSAFL